MVAAEKGRCLMEIDMKMFGKVLVGAAMLVGTALAATGPAAAQPGYGYGGNGYDRNYYGDTYNGRNTYGDSRGYYGNDRFRAPDRWQQRRGTWRWDPILHRRVWVPYRYMRTYRDNWRYGAPVWGRY